MELYQAVHKAPHIYLKHIAVCIGQTLRTYSTGCTVIKGSYVCRDNRELRCDVCVQAEGVFRCLVDYDDNFSENPTEAAVVLCFNGPPLCRRGNFFFPRKVVMCGCGDGANSFWLFILHSVMQVLHGGQLTVNHLFSLFSEWVEAGENETVMDDVEMLSAIDLRKWTTF